MVRSSATVVRCSERRTQPRFPGERICATVRIKGRWGVRQSVSVIDFNRHGMSITTDRALNAPKGLCVGLTCDDLSLPDLHAVIHNCRATVRDGTTSYRLGIQFRPGAKDQFDRAEVERMLERMEQRVAEQTE